MHRYSLIAAGLVLSLAAVAADAGETMKEYERDSLDLAGAWEGLLDHGDQEMWRTEEAAKVDWKPVDISTHLPPQLGVKREAFPKVKCAWIRRQFDVPAARARRGAVLRWGGIRFGATVWINGSQVGSHPVMGPHAMLLPKGTLQAGRNDIVLKMPGWAGIPMSASGRPLIPTGSGTQGWGPKSPCVYDEIWLDFYDRAYVRTVLAMPDVDNRTVAFRIAMEAAGKLPEQVDLSARVVPVGGKAAAGTGSAVADAKGRADLVVPVKNPKLWTPDEPNLYEAEITARAAGKACDQVRFRFGMRQVGIRGGRYVLNGRPLWLRGSNLVFEWQWGGPEGLFNRQVKRYIVDEARLMNLNSFRTHTIPPPARWLDTADEGGTMIWAELPVLYNYRDFQFTPSEYEVFHKHALLDAIGWVGKLGNHPSVILWVISNETNVDNEWEAGPYYRHVKKLDPTRPALRSGGIGGTPDVLDIHTCGNWGGPNEGSLLVDIARQVKERDGKRPLSNSEYMNKFADRDYYSHKWLGGPRNPATDLVFAEFAAEHTEAMRRARFDGLLPYMYAGWTSLRRRAPWRSEFPCPMAAALHSSMAPVLASLDLFDRNFLPGIKQTTPLVLINELHEDVEVQVDLLLTGEDPQFVPDEQALAAATWRDGFKATLQADSFATRQVEWPVPEKEGSWFLAAVVRRAGDTPVISQRVVRAIDPAATAKGVGSPNVCLLGAPAAAEKWLKRWKIPVVTAAPGGRIAGDVAVIWDKAALAGDARPDVQAVRRFVADGGRLVVLAERGWDWKELLDVELVKAKSSRTFAYSRARREAVLKGVAGTEFMKRLNGLPGTAAEVYITGPAVEADTCTKLMWVCDPDKPALIRVASGQGEILFTTLALRTRITPANATYDPAAERMLLNLIARR